MQPTNTSAAKQSWTDLLAKEKSAISNSGGIKSTAPLPHATNAGQETAGSDPPRTSSPDDDGAVDPHDKCRWYVMWVTRGRKDTATAYFKEQDITCWIPEVTHKIKVDGKMVERQENLLGNKLFILIEPTHLQLLRDTDRDNPFLAYVRDRTKEKVGNDYPPMIIPRHEMRNFQRFIAANDEHMVEVSDSSRVHYKGEKNTFVVVEGKHAGLKGKWARYKKHDRIIVQCGTWTFATGYIKEAFLKVLEANADDSQGSSQSGAAATPPFAKRISDEKFNKLLTAGGATSPNIAFETDRTLTAAQIERWLTLRFPRHDDSQWYVLRAKGHTPVSACLELKERGIPTFIPLRKAPTYDSSGTAYEWTPMSSEYIYAYASAEALDAAMQGTVLTYHYHSGASFARDSHPLYVINEERMRRFILAACLANGFIYPMDKDVDYVGKNEVEVTAGRYAGAVGRPFRDNDKLKVAVNNGLQTFATGQVNDKGCRAISEANEGMKIMKE